MKGGMSGGGGQQAPAPNPISSWFGGARNAISQAIANAMKARTAQTTSGGAPMQGPPGEIRGPVANSGYPMPTRGAAPQPQQPVLRDDYGRVIPAESPIAKALMRRSNPYGQ